ncbi:hypothetical protein C2E23DRAFT_804821 [Lenzites betulinus]|nr:hypothetical protein C2E23DRAFT_804821 [Lenzites betulinus]
MLSPHRAASGHPAAKKIEDARDAVKAAHLKAQSSGKPSGSILSPISPPPLDYPERGVACDRVRATCSPAELDYAIGRTIVGTPEPQPEPGVREKYEIRDVVIDRFCRERRMARCAPDVPCIPLKYRHTAESINVIDYPVVFLDTINALYVDSVTKACSGFAYMTQFGVSSLPTGPFHLFNAPTAPETLVEHDTPFNTSKWRYCGIYECVWSGYALSQYGIDHMLPATKEAWAASISARDCIIDISRVTPKHMAGMHGLFDRGIIDFPLVVLECLGFPTKYADMLASRDWQEPLPVKRTTRPPPPTRAVIEERERAEAAMIAQKREGTLNLERMHL